MSGTNAEFVQKGISDFLRCIENVEYIFSCALVVVFVVFVLLFVCFWYFVVVFVCLWFGFFFF